MFCHRDYDEHERVIFAHQPDAGLSAIIAIHSTSLGPAFGGCRMFPYQNDAEALRDVLRLSKSMTYKSAICGLPLGGGKSVVLGNPKTDKTPALLRAMGRLVNELQGRYFIADDVGITLDDLAIVQEETEYSAATSAAMREAIPVTAAGVFSALRAAASHCLKQDQLQDVTVGVQGLGVVGYPLCAFLSKAGARLLVSDLDHDRTDQAVRTFGAKAVPVEEIYDQQMDIFAPCALGGVINAETSKRLKTKLICGGANNQLTDPNLATEIMRRHIVYVPDYLANAGGVIDFALERKGADASRVHHEVERIGSITTDVLAKAKSLNVTPLAICDQRVQETLQRARNAV